MVNFLLDTLKKICKTISRIQVFYQQCRWVEDSIDGPNRATSSRHKLGKNTGSFPWLLEGVGSRDHNFKSKKELLDEVFFSKV